MISPASTSSVSFPNIQKKSENPHPKKLPIQNFRFSALAAEQNIVFDLASKVQQMKSKAPFYQALHDPESDETDRQFEFENHTYTLERKWHKDACIYVVRNATISRLCKELTVEAKDYFLALTELEEVGNVDENSPIVSGDMDGSTVRQILLGIQAGMIDIDAEGILYLAFLINTEAWLLKELNTGDGTREWDILVGFQENPLLQDILEKLVPHLQFKHGHAPFISIGDGAHDRFSCNKDVDLYIRERLAENGAIFIRGNHDVYFHKNKNPQFGMFAKNLTSCDEWMAHEKKVFSNAHYHQATNTLYIHHGLRRNRKDRQLIDTAYGSYRLPQNGKFDPVHFVNWINMQELPIPDEKFEEGTTSEIDRKENAYYYEDIHDFRPAESEMLELSEEWGVAISHGHNGPMNTSLGNVLVLNSRYLDDGELKYIPVAVRVGSFFVSQRSL